MTLLLATERERSDPDGRWRKHMEKEQQWLDGVLEGGGAVDSSEMPRLIRAWGGDDLEEEQRLCCIGQPQCECG